MDTTRLRLIPGSHGCKGYVYRLTINQFITKDNRVIHKETMTPLKRESCDGCKQCGGLHYELRERIENNENILIESPEHKAKYYFAIDYESRNWETGIIDDYDLVFRRVQE